MELPSFVKSQWFVLFGLVAIVSMGTLIFDIAAGKFGSQKVVQTQEVKTLPSSTASPIQATPIPVLKAKRFGLWLVDAAGGQDADSRDLGAVVGNAAAGDTIEIRPGQYRGEIQISKPMHLKGIKGQNPAFGDIAEIYGETRDTFAITGDVTLEGLTVTQRTAGTICAINLGASGSISLNFCKLTSRSTFVLLVSQNSRVTATRSLFQSFNVGCAVKLEGNTNGSLQDCEFSENQFGTQVIGASHLQILRCAYQRNGKPNGDGNTAVATGSQASLTIDQCMFRGNMAPIYCFEGASLKVSNTQFQGNGITGEGTVNNGGLIVSQTGGNVLVEACALNENKQGLIAKEGGKMQVLNCRFQKNGASTQNEQLKVLCSTIFVNGFNSEIDVKSSSLDDSVFMGMWADYGGKLVATDVTVTGGNYGIQIGEEKGSASGEFQKVTVAQCAALPIFVGGGSRATFDACRFSNSANGIDLLQVGPGSHAGVTNCEFVSGAGNGLECYGLNASATISDSRLSGLQGCGVLSYGEANVAVKNCVIENNLWGVQAGIATQPDGAADMSVENCEINGTRNDAVIALGRGRITLRGVKFRNNAQKIYYSKFASVIQQ
jgi:hypothetical protein